MKNSFKLLSWIGMVLGMFSMSTALHAIEYETVKFCVDGIWYRIYTNNPNCTSAAVIDPRGVDQPPYAGNVIIPSEVTLDGATYPVEDVLYAFYGATELDSIYIPDSVDFISEGTFADCNANSVSIPNVFPMGIQELAFRDAKVGKLTIRTKNDENIRFWGRTFESDAIDTIKVEPVKEMSISWISTVVKCFHICHADTIHLEREWYFSRKADTPSPLFMIVDDAEPPVATGITDSDAMGQTLLFVPDGSEDLYRNATYWKTFLAVYPQSRLPEVDSLLASGIEKVDVDMGDDEISVTVADGTISVSGDFKADAIFRICDLHGREVATMTAGRSLSLSPGMYIISCGDLVKKVIVK